MQIDKTPFNTIFLIKNNLILINYFFENKDFKLSVKSLSQTVADYIDYTNLIEKENQKIQRIKNAYLEGIYTVEEVKEYKKSVEDKIKNLSSRQVQLKQEKTKPRKENVKEKFFEKLTDVFCGNIKYEITGDGFEPFGVNE